MSDDVSYAASIGASINKGLGSIKPPKPKKPKATEEKGPKKVKSTRTNAPTKEKKDKNIVDAVIVEPVKVTSERLNTPKEITTGQKQLTHTPTIGKQFTGYSNTYGSTHTQPPVDLSKF
jgi:hypothetical protein